MDSDNGKTLFVDCCSGREGATEVFVRRFSNLVYSVILRTLKVKGIAYSLQDLDDLHNTVFERLIERNCRRLRLFKGKDGCSPASWVRMITVRTVLDYLRDSKDALSHKSRLEDIEVIFNSLMDAPEPLQILDSIEKRQMLRAAMDKLIPRDRLFLKLHCLEELSIREVAAFLNISENNAYSLKNRAIQRLKAVVEVQCKNTESLQERTRSSITKNI
jgi:RNA polymerase sigma factor (sigma-70 family)